MKLNAITMTYTELVRISAIGFCLFLCTSCQQCIDGEGSIVKESTPLDSFASVILKCPADVYLSQNYFPRTVTVKAQENIAELLDFKVVDYQLIIDTKTCFRSGEAVEVYVNSNVFEALKVNGSGDIHSLTDIIGRKLNIAINGSGDVTAEIKNRLTVVSINGSGDVNLSGAADRMEVSINGSGDVKAPNMTCESTSVNISGSGDVFVNAEKYLEANIRGSGDLRYTGFPTDTIFSIKGSGTIRSAY